MSRPVDKLTRIGLRRCCWELLAGKPSAYSLVIDKLRAKDVSLLSSRGKAYYSAFITALDQALALGWVHGISDGPLPRITLKGNRAERFVVLSAIQLGFEIGREQRSRGSFRPRSPLETPGQDQILQPH
jgi:hypothetical protein